MDLKQADKIAITIEVDGDVYAVVLPLEVKRQIVTFGAAFSDDRSITVVKLSSDFKFCELSPDDYKTG